MSVDLNRIGEARQQLQMLEVQIQLQQQNIFTQQAALALDAAKFIITLERSEENVTNFSDEEVVLAYDTVARISRIVVLQSPAPAGEAQEAAGLTNP